LVLFRTDTDLTDIHRTRPYRCNRWNRSSVGWNPYAEGPAMSGVATGSIDAVASQTIETIALKHSFL
jgi:hypothetical protein